MFYFFKNSPALFVFSSFRTTGLWLCCLSCFESFFYFFKLLGGRLETLTSVFFVDLIQEFQEFGQLFVIRFHRCCCRICFGNGLNHTFCYSLPIFSKVLICVSYILCSSYCLFKNHRPIELIYKYNEKDCGRWQL